MALNTFVKISKISNLSDARYCAGMGVDQLGFNFNPKVPDAISVELFDELKGWIAGVKYVGEFGDMPANQLIELQSRLDLDYIETSRLDDVERINLLGKKISFNLSIDHHTHLQDFGGTMSYLDELVDQVVITSQSPSLFDEIKTEVNFYNGRIKLIKAFNVHVDTLSQIGNFHGIQMEGTPEDQPGFKDYGEVMDVLESLEID